MCDALWYGRLRKLLDNGGPTVHYQPIVDLWTGQVVGYEALTRGLPGEHGPEVWFTAAYDLRMTQELELASIRRALADFDGLQGYLSVNVSPKLLATKNGLIELIPPGLSLVVEVTETIPIQDYELLKILKTIHELRQVGVRIAVDDAGQGYALRNVTDLLPDLLKLDRVFMRGLHSRDEDTRRGMLRSALYMAGQFHADVIAEGVESYDEVLALRVLGVKYGQGYYFSPARPAAELVNVDVLPMSS